jgi:alanine racemase
MDLITLDLRGVEARPGDEVELWGRALPVDEVAQAIGTISYDLTCAAGAHVAREYLNPAPTLTAPAGG